MILQQLLEHTRNNLQETQIEYLTNRGISNESIEKWQIGYLPDQKALLDISEDLSELHKTGILIKDITKSPLHQYITFPMYNQYNQLVAFSGRPPLHNDIVKQRKLRKYWHSIFEKRKFLFGLNKAVSAIREKGYAIVGEGQFDTITAHQNGLENVVSTCGTALTTNHIITLARYTNKAYVIFDTDDAGEKAFAKLSEKTTEGIQLIPLKLPVGPNNEKEDIDSYLRKFGILEFNKLIKTKNSSWDLDL